MSGKGVPTGHLKWTRGINVILSCWSKFKEKIKRYLK
jgi:hypothetical protein